MEDLDIDVKGKTKKVCYNCGGINEFFTLEHSSEIFHKDINHDYLYRGLFACNECGVLDVLETYQLIEVMNMNNELLTALREEMGELTTANHLVKEQCMNFNNGKQRKFSFCKECLSFVYRYTHNDEYLYIGLNDDDKGNKVCQHCHAAKPTEDFIWNRYSITKK